MLQIMTIIPLRTMRVKVNFTELHLHKKKQDVCKGHSNDSTICCN